MGVELRMSWVRWDGLFGAVSDFSAPTINYANAPVLSRVSACRERNGNVEGEEDARCDEGQSARGRPAIDLVFLDVWRLRLHP